jgi:hypothetical protein
VLHLSSDGTALLANPNFERPRWVTVDSTDGSCWVSDGVHENKNIGSLVHLSEEGIELCRGGGIGWDSPIAVSEWNGSIWVVDGMSGQLARFRLWFHDVPRIHWAFKAILACAEASLVAGYADGLYRPDNNVSRDQMAVYIARALAGGDDSVPDPTGDPTFPDVPADFWAHKYVEYAVESNVVAGYEDGLYHPELTVDRAQMAVYVARSIATPTGEEGLIGYTPSDPRSFPDVPEDFWAWLHIEYCVENGVVQGYEDGYYHPEYLVTRDQMAVYIARAFDLLE